MAAKDESFAAERARLKELELKVTRLEEIIDSQKERDIGSAIGQNSVGRSVSFPRTCRELRASDPTLTSGMHWIDPDGQGVGDDPIYVYCNMATGKLIVETYLRLYVS